MWPLFEGLVDGGEFETGQEEVDAEANSDLLDMDDMKEDYSTYPATHFRPSAELEWHLWWMVICMMSADGGASKLSIPGLQLKAQRGENVLCMMVRGSHRLLCHSNSLYLLSQFV